MDTKIAVDGAHDSHCLSSDQNSNQVIKDPTEIEGKHNKLGAFCGICLNTGVDNTVFWSHNGEDHILLFKFFCNKTTALGIFHLATVTLFLTPNQGIFQFGCNARNQLEHFFNGGIQTMRHHHQRSSWLSHWRRRVDLVPGVKGQVSVGVQRCGCCTWLGCDHQRVACE